MKEREFVVGSFNTKLAVTRMYGLRFRPNIEKLRVEIRKRLGSIAEIELACTQVIKVTTVDLDTLAQVEDELRSIEDAVLKAQEMLSAMDFVAS